MEDLKKLLSSIDVKADFVGLRRSRQMGQQYSFRDGKPASSYSLGGKTAMHPSFEDDGIMVEVMKDGLMAYAGTCDTSASGVKRAADQALSKVEKFSRYKTADLTPEIRPSNVGEYTSSVDKKLSQLDVKGLIDLLQESNAKMNISDKIVSRSADLSCNEVTTDYVNTNAAEIHQEFSFLDIGYTATASNEGISQTRSNSGRGDSHQRGLEGIRKEHILEDSVRIAEEALELVTTAEDCPTGTMSLVLDPGQMMLQIHESIGHPLEIDRILGDERNYAGSSFVQLEDFGKLQYGSKVMNVTFDPSIRDEYASYGFDDAGQKAEKEYLIKDGLLVKGLGSLESQARSGVPGVANFRASSWNRAPIDRMANINIEPGSGSFDELVSGVEKGVYMHSNRSWSIDDYRNKFQFGCEYGKLIENGKLTKTLRNPNYRGVSSSFWKSLSAVGGAENFAYFGTPYCGKGEPNQLIRVGHGSPVCVFSNIEVFGGC